MEIGCLRRRLPLVAFVLLAVICLLMLGFACACLSDHPGKATERSIAAPSFAVPVIEVWSPLAVVLGGLGVLLVLAPTVAQGRASPAELQRFLF